jgi:hypothetical protein
MVTLNLTSSVQPFRSSENGVVLPPLRAPEVCVPTAPEEDLPQTDRKFLDIFVLLEDFLKYVEGTKNTLEDKYRINAVTQRHVTVGADNAQNFIVGIVEDPGTFDMTDLTSSTGVSRETLNKIKKEMQTDSSDPSKGYDTAKLGEAVRKVLLGSSKKGICSGPLLQVETSLASSNLNIKRFEGPEPKGDFETVPAHRFAIRGGYPIPVGIGTLRADGYYIMEDYQDRSDSSDPDKYALGVGLHFTGSYLKEALGIEAYSYYDVMHNDYEYAGNPGLRIGRDQILTLGGALSSNFGLPGLRVRGFFEYSLNWGDQYKANFLDEFGVGGLGQSLRTGGSARFDGGGFRAEVSGAYFKGAQKVPRKLNPVFGEIGDLSLGTLTSSGWDLQLTVGMPEILIPWWASYGYRQQSSDVDALEKLNLGYWALGADFQKLWGLLPKVEMVGGFYNNNLFARTATEKFFNTRFSWELFSFNQDRCRFNLYTDIGFNELLDRNTGAGETQVLTNTGLNFTWDLGAPAKKK